MMRLTDCLNVSPVLNVAICLVLIGVESAQTFAAEDDKANFAKWEASIKKFESQDQQTPPPKMANLFVGSSSIRMWKLDKSFPKFKTINRGFGGSEISDSIHFADRIILKHQPAVILLYAGDNDISHGKSAEIVTADFQKFVSVVRKKLPDTKIGFIAIKPSIKRWNLAGEMRKANKAIASICQKDDQLTFVDVFEPMIGKDGKPRPELFLNDGLHMNDAGYKVWASKVRPLLK